MIADSRLLSARPLLANLRRRATRSSASSMLLILRSLLSAFANAGMSAAHEGRTGPASSSSSSVSVKSITGSAAAAGAADPCVLSDDLDAFAEGWFNASSSRRSTEPLSFVLPLSMRRTAGRVICLSGGSSSSSSLSSTATTSCILLLPARASSDAWVSLCAYVVVPFEADPFSKFGLGFSSAGVFALDDAASLCCSDRQPGDAYLLSSVCHSPSGSIITSSTESGHAARILSK